MNNINLKLVNSRKYNSSKVFVNLDNSEMSANKSKSPKYNILQPTQSLIPVLPIDIITLTLNPIYQIKKNLDINIIPKLCIPYVDSKST